MATYRGQKPRTRVKTVARGRIISSDQGGPIAHTLKVFDPWLDKKKPRERNAIVRTALHIAGIGWLSNDLERRYSTYAESKLNYPSHKKRGKRMKRGSPTMFTVNGVPVRENMPFVEAGTMAAVSLTRHNAKATATANRQRVRLTIPRGHALRPEFQASFATVTRQEVVAIAKRLRAALNSLMKGRSDLAKRAERIKTRGS